MKRIVNFGFQALKQIIGLTVLRKCAQRMTLKNMLSDSPCCLSYNHTAKRVKSKMTTQEQIFLLNLLI